MYGESKDSFCKEGITPFMVAPAKNLDDQNLEDDLTPERSETPQWGKWLGTFNTYKTKVPSISGKNLQEVPRERGSYKAAIIQLFFAPLKNLDYTWKLISPLTSQTPQWGKCLGT